LLPDTSSQSAYEIAERLRLSIQNKVWSCKDFADVTVSIGISSNQRESDKIFAQLIKNADINMYQAKKLGKNRVYF
jgi:diguanylate cyclase (GGDEF)-like protein